MNRNVESHFSLLPTADISRSRFDRSQDIKFTFNVGELIPFFIDEVLPGDTFNLTTSKVVRLQTLLYPIMDNMYLDTYFFFVPNRLVWSHWRELMGENTQSAWLPEIEYSVPQIVFREASAGEHGSGRVARGDILDYMGVPIGTRATDPTDNTVSISALPYRAYCKIFNDWFRDENLTDPVNFNTGDSDEEYYSLQDNSLEKPFLAAKYHDYFTSALPSPQKGPKVRVPFSDTGYATVFPVYSTDHTHSVDPNLVGYSGRALHGIRHNTAASGLDDALVGLTTETAVDPSGNAYVDASFIKPLAVPDTLGFYPDNLYTKIRFADATSAGIDVNDLRYAFQLQKLYERDARGGTRYIELIKSHFNVDSPDARLQRSEYLGGNRVALNIHQITNQSQGESDFLGDVGAMSLTTDKHSDFTKSFTEHGFILGICCVRYDHSYPQGLERFWRRKQRFDFYWPVFANLGEQDIKKSEICWNASGSSQNSVFGYQERWAEYRYKPNRVAGEMRPYGTNNLGAWHLSDYYTTVPSLSDSWIREDKSNVDRVLAVTSSVSNQVLADIYVQNYTTRPMPLYSIPGLIDHH